MYSSQSRSSSLSQKRRSTASKVGLLPLVIMTSWGGERDWVPVFSIVVVVVSVFFFSKPRTPPGGECCSRTCLAAQECKGP